MPHHTNTIADWLVSNRLYEDNLFYYALIICFWFFIGFAFLGFELEGFSLQQNLFFNFVFYLFICTMMALCPFWFKFFFSKTHTAKREQELQQALDELDEYDRAEVEAELAHTGGLAMRPVQRWALVFLGSYFLFEVFFISAWVKDMALVWQPDWVMGIVEWVRENTDSRSLPDGGSLFDFSSRIGRDDFLLNYYQTETEFLASELGKSAMLFTFWKFISFFPIVFALMGAFGLMSGWLGIGAIKERSQTNLWGFIVSTAFLCGAGLMALMSVIMVIVVSDDTKIIPLATNKIGFLILFKWNILYIFTMIFLILVINYILTITSFINNLLRSQQ
ncbi:Uncharacterised protein [Moraxella lacunata]|uniref:Uncharacterized protein n=1 Tax=Moraxella lacunata TaxID=477 RepID=A0A378QIF2_MORLA|nr:hypothetical protein [Moraxella lacunata]STZ00528.1 Uncharacterised protein [Moraxella lacunata]